MIPPNLEYINIIEISDDEFDTLVNLTLEEYDRVFGDVDELMLKTISPNKKVNEKRGRPSKPQHVSDNLTMNKAL